MKMDRDCHTWDASISASNIRRHSNVLIISTFLLGQMLKRYFVCICCLCLCHNCEPGFRALLLPRPLCDKCLFQNKLCHIECPGDTPNQITPWHQLDLVNTRHESLNGISNTRAYHSGKFTNHSLIASRVKLKPKKLFHSKQKS